MERINIGDVRAIHLPSFGPVGGRGAYRLRLDVPGLADPGLADPGLADPGRLDVPGRTVVPALAAAGEPGANAGYAFDEDACFAHTCVSP